MTRINGTLSKGSGSERFARYVTVELPPAHEGVGRALRDVYFPTTGLPSDITALLDKLDKL